MEPLGLTEFDRQSAEFDALVAATPDIDHFCSASHWILPASRALMPPRRPWLFRSPGCQVALMRCRHPEGWHYLEPLEAMWGLACPLIGAAGAETSALLAELLRRREADWRVAVLLGMPVPSPLFGHLVRRLADRYELRQGPVTTRCVASLSGGLDGFLGRRSRNFRKALRRTLRAARSAGIEVEAVHPDNAEEARISYERAVAVERRSWKGQAGVGIESGAMHEFYRAMVPRLARRGALEMLFARDPRRGADPDIAFVMGGIFEGTYRGLQFSFDAGYEHLALGNLCQYHQIARLCDQGITAYDLGTDMEYKHRWAETRRDTLGLIVVRR